MRHRSTLKQKNKAHKDGHAPGPKPSSGFSPAPTPEKGQKERRLQSLEARRQTKIDASKIAKQVGSKNGPPKIVALLPCSANSSPDAFLSIFDFHPESDGLLIPSGTLTGGQFSCKITPIPIPRDCEQLIDIGKVADIIILLFHIGEPLDEWAATAIRVLKSIGLPECIAVIASPTGDPVPRGLLAQYRRNIQSDLPDVERVLPLATSDDMHQFVRFLSVTAPSTLSWRQDRPYMLVQRYESHGDGTVTVEGYLRSAGLCVHQIVTVPYVGDFQIVEANGVIPSEALRHPMVYEAGEDVDLLTADIHPPQTVEPPERPQEAVAQTDEERGEEEDEGSVATEFDDGEAEAARIEAAYERAQAELEFPDEFDKYDGSVPLRDRLRRYRGLKSFKNSAWDSYESLPPHYARLVEFANFTRTAAAAIAEQAQAEIAPGVVVTIRLAAAHAIDVWGRVPPGRVLAMFGLFRHETRISVLNCTIRNCGQDPIPSKAPLLMICGFRHLWIAPLFSEDTRAAKFHMLRGIEPGQSAVASFTAPAILQSVPVTYFRSIDGLMYMCGTGSVKSVDPLRMIIKRIVLTGNPYKTIGRTARVTLMFFNKEDVAWFKSVGLNTKRKQRGHIEKAIGVTGRFKAMFKEIARPDDTICMYLYKRVFPRLCHEDGSYVTAPVSF